MAPQPTVLIVDDEEIGRETLEDLLITQGYHLAFASGGPEALAKAAELRPDLVLLDVMMPGMDGFEVCRRLRADPLLSKVPIVLVTALDDRDSRLRGIEAGADDFISKPFDRVELRARVRTITRLNRYRHLLTERKKFEWAVEQANEGYVVLGAADEIVYANPQARSFLGLPPDKTPVIETFMVLAQAHYQRRPEEVWETWPEPLPEPARYLVRPETQVERALWLQVDSLALESTGGIDSGADERYLIRLYDVTSRVEKQTVMWGFHKQISHKLRTPLGHIIGYLDFLVDEHTTMAEQHVQDSLDAVYAGALQLEDELTDVFQYLDALQMSGPDQQGCRMDEIPAMIEEIKSNLELGSVELTYSEIEAPEDFCVSLTRRAMDLILWELLENAKQFHPRHDPVVEVVIADHPDGVRLRVRDDGRALSPEQLAKVWMPYYQVEKYFTGQVPGMGLGLAMVNALVWQVGGACRMYNREKGPGVVVEIRLPELLEAGS